MQIIRSLVSFVSLALVVVYAASKNDNTKTKKSDPNDNKGLTPFFLQDPKDSTCLGPDGFTQCDENALWMLTKRQGKETYSLVSVLNPSSDLCLQRKSSFFGLFSSNDLGLGPCSKASAKAWDWEFIDSVHVKLSNQGHCLVRGKNGFKNSVSVQNCNKNEYIPLVYHPTAVHENGFNLKAADGTCFDGSKFRTCSGTGSNKLYWGIGIKYVWNEARRYFFNFAPNDLNSCIVANGKKVEKGSCSNNNALSWALKDGKLSFKFGQQCIARKADDTVVLTDCKAGNEFITMDIPTLYSNDQVLKILQNSNLSQKEKTVLVDALQNKGLLSAP